MPNEKKQTNRLASSPKKKAVYAHDDSGAAIQLSRAKATTAAAKQKSPTVKSISVKVQPAVKKVKSLHRIIFQVRFHTHFGQQIFLLGDHPLLGDNDQEKAVAMHYFDKEHWYAVIDTEKVAFPDRNIAYNYFVKNADDSISFDWGADKFFAPGSLQAEELVCLDAWNYAGYYQNSFYTEPFRQVLLKANYTKIQTPTPKKITHTLRVKTPLLAQGQTLCVLGSCDLLGNWDTENPVVMGKKEEEDAYEISFDLSKQGFPIAYKYGVYDCVNSKFVRYEDGNNRVLHDAGKANRLTVLHDGWAVLPGHTWKGAGMAIPVFSLRTENSFGIGEFSDLHLLTDWAKQAGLTMIQLLPINDTTATHSWMDSYPYAAISAFALHPVYLNIEKIDGKKNSTQLKKLAAEKKRLNALPVVDYEVVSKIKWEYTVALYKSDKGAFLDDTKYQLFFSQNRHWLVPYAAFCYLRDQYGTVDFHQWPAYRKYRAGDIEALTSASSSAFTDIALYYFVQYHLHLQLKEATAYAHENGIVVKGDIAIGVYRHGADAWQSPELYNMNFQAGAPPDDFAIAGQNWGFPTYNWQRMHDDGYTWWKQRFEQMSCYFDAFRIDHILGFFRIWSIPMHAVEGILGHFVPAIPVQIHEFQQRNIWFDHARYTKPFINETVLWEIFGSDNELVKSMFLKYDGDGNYRLKPEYATQRQVEKHFQLLDQDAFHARVQQGLYNLISNVILFDAEDSESQAFHFRFDMGKTASFQYLDLGTQQQLRELYVDYYFRRQDHLWMKEGIQKLPALKRVTNMLVCGEDLGLVPSCVPEAMRQLGLLGLEIQRMPKKAGNIFFHPADAPYLSVVTPSTHDMSTIRGWWQEDKESIQQFYNHELGQWGEAPTVCEPWINKAIVLQHLHSPAMWSIFQLQDLLGIDENLRRKNFEEERINVPANPKHYWQYRMHLTIEELLQAGAFTAQLKEMINSSGRGAG